MTTSHIDQLAEWWENAEEGEAAPGDWIITHGPDDTNPAYIVEQAPRYPLSSKRQPYRILARAPKPKPAWHDAKAVIADVGRVDRARRAFVKDENGIWNDALTGHGYTTGDLRDVTPLIEAKVTDDQARTTLDTYYEYAPGEHDWSEDTIYLMRHAIATALGIEDQ